MIFTFYSYKGGVGRSMALANVAKWFYLQGLRVVMIDWDLEAPGLESFFYDSNNEKQKQELEVVRSQLGLIDTLLAYKRKFPRLPQPSDNEKAEEQKIEDDSPTLFEQKLAILRDNLPPISDLLYPICPSKTSANGMTSVLWLLPAGWRSGDHFPIYAQAVQNFDWAEFYDSFDGEVYFEWMREQLNSQKLADVVLIDSRTGVTEMGGVCTQQLADIVVSFCVPNLQNMNGVATMVASFKRDDIAKKRGNKLETVVVPTRLDSSEKDAKNLFEKRFREALEKFTPTAFRTINRTFWDLRIPYIPAYAYSEALAIGNPDADKDLEEAYKILTAHLVMLAPGGSTIRRGFTDELQRVFGKQLPSICLSYVGSEGKTIAAELRKRLEENDISLWPDLADVHKQPNGWQQVTGTLDQAKSLIIVMTPDAMNAESVRKEWRYARQQGVCIYPVKKESNGREVNFEALPRWMRCTNVYDLNHDWEAFIRSVDGPCQATRVPFMPPDLPEGVVERPVEFNQLKDALLNAEHNAANAVLWGPGGSGKSVLATALCQDENTITYFNDGILWVALGTNPNVQAELTKLYTALTGDRPMFFDEDEAAMRLAERLSDKECLIVIDDVWDASHLKPFLRGGSRCSCLVTTRNLNVIADFGSKLITIPVGEMTAEQAVQVIAIQTQMSRQAISSIREIAQSLDNYPLSLKLFDVALQKRLGLGEKLEDALEDLKQAFHKRGVIAFDLPRTTDANQSVAISMTRSLTSLTEKERDYYLQLAFFPEDIDFSLGEVSQLWGMDEVDTKELIQRLSYLSLLKYDVEKKTISLYGVMRSFILTQMPEQMGLDTKIESAFAHFLPEEQKARRVLTRLVRVAKPEGGDEDSRQRVKLAEFDEASRAMLKKLSDVRLVVIDQDEKSGEAMVQVADEAFIKRWERLRNWVNQDRKFLLWRQQLRAKIAEWVDTKQDQGALLSGLPLAIAREWLDERGEDLNQAERSYITESSRVELALVTEAKKLRRRQRASMITSAAVIVLLVVGVISLWFLNRPQRSNGISEKVAAADYRQGLEELKAGQLDAAEKNFNDAIINKPDYAEAYLGLGRVYKERGNLDKAQELFTNALDYNPRFIEAYLNRGSVFLAQNKYQNAVNDYTKALEVEPDNPFSYNDRGVSYQRLGMYNEAAADYAKAIKLKTEYPDPYYNLGTAYAERGNYDAAIENFERAIYYKYNGEDVYLKIGDAYKGKYDKSKDKKDRDDAITTYQLLLLLAKEKNIQELSQTAEQRLQELGTNPDQTLTVATPTITIFFIDPDDEAEYSKGIYADLRKRKYRVQRGAPAPSATTDGEVRYFHPEDDRNANEILKIVQNDLEKIGFEDQLSLTASIDWGRRRNVTRGYIEVWIPLLPKNQVPALYLNSERGY